LRHYYLRKYFCNLLKIRNRFWSSEVKYRTLFTIAYGKLKIRETIKKCVVCHAKYNSEQLPQLVKSGSNYSYDCIVEVGRLRYFDKRQIIEIQSIFKKSYQLMVSLTQIRRMAYTFLLYLGKLHYSKLEMINIELNRQGGYILYVDSTCDGRAPHLLTCLDGLSGYVLYSQKIQSENAQELRTAFEKVKKLFGTPLCCVHDMGSFHFNFLSKNRDSFQTFQEPIFSTIPFW